MDMQKIRGLSDQDLHTEQGKASEQLFRIRFQKSLGNQEGIKGLRSLKLDIARLKTTERERAVARERQAHPVIKAVAPAPSQRTARKNAERTAHEKSKRS